MRQKYNWQLLDEVIKREGERMSTADLSKLTNVPIVQLRIRCKRLGVKPPTSQDIKINYILRNPGKPTYLLAYNLGCSEQHIRHIRRTISKANIADQ